MRRVCVRLKRSAEGRMAIIAAEINQLRTGFEYGNPVTFWIRTSLTDAEIEQIDGVELVVESTQQ